MHLAEKLRSVHWFTLHYCFGTLSFALQCMLWLSHLAESLAFDLFLLIFTRANHDKVTHHKKDTDKISINVCCRVAALPSSPVLLASSFVSGDGPL